MRTDEKYIRSLERRIRNQRVQLHWWQREFERGNLRRPKRWTVYQVCDLLRRLGSPHRVTDGGRMVTKRIPFPKVETK